MPKLIIMDYLVGSTCSYSHLKIGKSLHIFNSLVNVASENVSGST